MNKLPIVIYNLIFFEFNPTPLKEFLLTRLNNHYAISFRHFIYPSFKYEPFFRQTNLIILLNILIRLRMFYAPLKKYKSRRFLKTIKYKDFPYIEKLIYTRRYSLFFNNNKLNHVQTYKYGID